ncbi:hypothetical protein ACU4GD_22450 [Cupriavidus basilensis]
MSRILVSGATLVTMEPTLGEFTGDLLIEGRAHRRDRAAHRGG